MRPTSSTPLWLAAIWARRSARLVAGLREGWGASVSRRRVSSSRNRPFSVSSQLSKRTPSSSMVRLFAGMEPGAMPPISAWWPREAT
ncbi:hypothetical protein SALBM217S_06185 [Streptomyces griseoloalbus]